MSGHALAEGMQIARVALRRRQIGGAIAKTACFNVVAAAAAALGGVIVARAVGPTVRGEYAAVISWFGLVLMMGGQASRPRCASTSPAIRSVPAATSPPPGR